MRVELRRRRLKSDVRVTVDSVEAGIAIDDAIIGSSLDIQCAAMQSFDSAHFEKIGEVGVELKHEGNANRLEAVIGQTNMLVTSCLSEEL